PARQIHAGGRIPHAPAGTKDTARKPKGTNRRMFWTTSRTVTWRRLATKSAAEKGAHSRSKQEARPASDGNRVTSRIPRITLNRARVRVEDSRFKNGIGTYADITTRRP